MSEALQFVIGVVIGLLASVPIALLIVAIGKRLGMTQRRSKP